MKYRVFAQIESLEVYLHANAASRRWLHILLPHARKDLWPDGKTGLLPTPTHAYLIVTGQR